MDGVTLSSDEFDHAYTQLKQIFRDHFLRNSFLSDVGLHADWLDRQAEKKIKGDFNGAFKSWCRSLLGEHCFLIAVLRHGLFDFSDLVRCAQELRREAQKAGGVTQPVRDNAKLRREALAARRAVKEAKKFQEWQSGGWICEPWQARQLQLLQIGELETRMSKANQAYGFGQNVQTCLTREQAMTLEVFTNGIMKDYFA